MTIIINDYVKLEGSILIILLLIIKLMAVLGLAFYFYKPQKYLFLFQTIFPEHQNAR